MTVCLQIKVRRFRCDNPECTRQTFAEQYMPFVGRRKRRTKRLLECVGHIGLTLGGAAGSRLGNALKMVAGGRLILQHLRQLPCPVATTTRIVGVDDWAFRKGKTYGTIIVDHESGKPIDLLPGRDTETVEQWLVQHPSIEIVTRDRSGEYRDAITQALPNAIQVADRWHLLKNMYEAIERHLSKRYQQIKKFILDIIEHEQIDIRTIKGTEKRRRYAPGPAQDALQAARTAKREAKFAYAKEQHAKGVYVMDIAKALNMSRNGVTEWLKHDKLPPDMRGRFKRFCLIDPYTDYLDQRIQEGCTNKSQLWREIRARGFTGSREMTTKWINQNYPAQHRSTRSKNQPRYGLPSVTELAWLLFRPKADMTNKEKMLLQLLLRDAQLNELRLHTRRFITMVNKRHHEKWEQWQQAVKQSGVGELKRFAQGLRRDGDAVYEALRQPHSNGRTEGHVNRLKLIKRQMYGRANFDLLRLRVLLAP